MYRSKEVYKKIRDEIIIGSLNPGERLIENDLATALNLSRGPIREAFRYLEKDGYINVVPNKGAVVTKVNIQEVKECYELLAVMESKAVEWAYINLTTEDVQELNKLNELLKSMKDEKEKIDVMKWSKINADFHKYIASRCGNSMLIDVIRDIRKRLFRLRSLSMLIKNNPDKYLTGHEDIIFFLRAHDSSGAQRAMERHIMEFGRSHLDVLASI